MALTTGPIPTADAPAKSRVALWDNARFALIVLVVVGHAISTIRADTALAYGLYVYIYAFHMPALIAMSGVFAKADVTPKIVKSTVQLLATWLVWEGLWAVVNFFFRDRVPGENFLISPAWTLWFLVTLVTMRILLPYLSRLRHPLIVSVVLALVGGLLPAIGSEFSASRTLCFLPFFMLGWLAKRDGWLDAGWFMRPSLGTRGAAWAVLGVFGVVVVVLAQVRSEWRFDSWLLWREDYFSIFDRAPVLGYVPESFWGFAAAGVGMRFVLLALAAALTLAFLLVLPRRSSIATKWGSRTLYVYLLHGLVIQALRLSGAVEWLGSFGELGVALLVFLGVAIAILLSMTWVTKVFKPIVEPPIGWLFAKEPDPPAPKRGSGA